MDEVPNALLAEEVLLELELDAVFAVTEFALCPSTGALIFGLIPCIFNCFSSLQNDFVTLVCPIDVHCWCSPVPRG